MAFKIVKPCHFIEYLTHSTNASIFAQAAGNFNVAALKIYTKCHCELATYIINHVRTYVCTLYIH